MRVRPFLGGGAWTVLLAPFGAQALLLGSEQGGDFCQIVASTRGLEVKLGCSAL